MPEIRWKCFCGSTETRTTVLESSVHYAKEVCAKCGKYVRFIGKPENLKPKRDKKHTDLVNLYSKGFCELCGIIASKIPNNEAMEAHHVIEYQHKGSENRENIWIICTACHKWIHWRRTYAHHIAKELYHAIDEDPGGTEKTESVDSLEDDPTF